MENKNKPRRVKPELHPTYHRPTNNYIVSFYKKGEKARDGDKYLGSVSIDDTGVTQHLTLTAKAFRHCNESCLMADIVRTELVK